MKEFNVLSLFDGMSCGQLALNKLGIKPTKYFASEIDKYAIKVTQANFPDTIQLGDVRDVHGKDLPKIHLLIGGSPCQGFSFAGKGLNFDDPRSKLFFEFVRLKNELNPDYFLLENVSMKKEHELVISKYLGTNPIEINSSLLTAQNRVRLYWTNINQKPYGLFGDMMADISQPKDKGILLKDILEPEVDEKYFISEKALQRVLRTGFSHPKFNPEKTGAINTKNNSGQLSVDSGTTLIDLKTMGGTSKTRRAGVNHEKSFTLDADCFQGVVNDSGSLRAIDKSMAIDANYWKGMDNHGQRTMVTEHQQDRVNHAHKKSRQLVAGTHGNSSAHTKTVIQVNENKESGGKQPYQQNRIYDTDGISPALMAEITSKTHLIRTTKDGFHSYRDDYKKSSIQGTHVTFEDGKTHCLNNHKPMVNTSRIRRLTEVECERLQSVPDNYTNYVSSSQRYKMLGNGWTIDVIAYIFSFIKLQTA